MEKPVIKLMRFFPPREAQSHLPDLQIYRWFVTSITLASPILSLYLAFSCFIYGIDGMSDAIPIRATLPQPLVLRLEE
jgi:hypothetical protein